MSLPAGDRQARSMGGYQLVRQLAAGGMAEVHLARQVVAGHMARLVVLKVPLAHLADEMGFVRMFRAEAALAAQLSHPNIVQIIDVAEVDGMPCIVMEYLQGLDLRDVLVRAGRARRRLPPEIVAMVGLGAALGLGYAHRRRDVDGRPLGVVHRDVSPHNLFLTRDGAVKLLDFGVAKSAAQLEKTKTGVVKGKLAYMAPEQLTTSTLDGRVDQWALGVVLWEMLTGKRLFRRDGGEALVLQAVLNEPIVAPSRHGATAELDAIVLRCLERDREKRYASCDELAGELQSYLRRLDARPESLALAQFLESLLDASVPPPVPGTDELVELETISASASVPSGLVSQISDSGFEIPELPLHVPPSEPPPPTTREPASARAKGLQEHATATAPRGAEVLPHAPSVTSGRRALTVVSWMVLLIVVAVGVGVAIGLASSLGRQPASRRGEPPALAGSRVGRDDRSAGTVTATVRACDASALEDT